jgi:hypothetical protein
LTSNSGGVIFPVLLIMEKEKIQLFDKLVALSVTFGVGLPA